MLDFWGVNVPISSSNLLPVSFTSKPTWVFYSPIQNHDFYPSLWICQANVFFKPLPKRLTLVHIQYTLASTQSQSLISWKNIFTTWNLKHLFPNGCFNWMIPNLYIAKHPFKTGCLGYQAHLVHHTLKRQTSSFSSKSPNCLENDSQVPKHHWSALVALCECVGCLGKFLIRTSYTPVN